MIDWKQALLACPGLAMFKDCPENVDVAEVAGDIRNSVHINLKSFPALTNADRRNLDSAYFNNGLLIEELAAQGIDVSSSMITSGGAIGIGVHLVLPLN